MRNSILISIFLTTNLLAQAQSPAKVQLVADSLFHDARYAKAYIEYERVAFFTTDANQQGKAASNQAFCALQLGDFHHAVILARKAIYRMDSFGTNARIIYLQAFGRQKAWDSLMANAKKFLTTDAKNSNRYRFYLMLGQIESEQYTEAVENGMMLTDEKGKYAIRKAWRKYRHRHKNPGFAGVLSFITPGLGQLYAHDAANAGKSFLINAVVGTLVYHQIYRESYYTASYLFIALVPRYYAGGIKNAAKSARFRNNELHLMLRKALIGNVILQNH